MAPELVYRMGEGVAEDEYGDEEEEVEACKEGEEDDESAD